MTKIFALVDCNSFYCSCERLFRPDLEGQPVGVLSNNDGCFISRTNELKKLGVKMGEPYFRVKKLCAKHNVAVFSANFSLYTNISDRVMNILTQFTPELEVYSIDEAFLDLTGFSNYDLIEYAHEIKNTVLRHTGIPVSIGLGPSKTLAKVANHIAKKSAKSQGMVSLLTEKLQDKALERTDIGAVWGIGRRSKDKMNALGIYTAKDLKDYKNKHHIQRVFTKVGLQTKEELEGHPRFDLQLVPDKKKEIICSRTFGKPVFDIGTLRQAVANYVTNACEKLRTQDSVCARVEVYARTSPFKNVPQYYAFEAVQMDSHTANTLKVIKYALIAVDKLFRQGFEYKKAGIKLSGIVDKNQSQLSLFERPDNEQSDRLMTSLDAINARDGAGTVTSGACGTSQRAWAMNQGHKSQRYVTGWTELPKVY